MTEKQHFQAPTLKSILAKLSSETTSHKLNNTDMDKKSTEQLIDQVRSEDRKVAHEAIANGVRESQERWIEAGLIAEALTAELVKIAYTCRSKRQIAALLQSIADDLTSEPNMH